jgi:3-oxoacyl-[acyl-carrier-protein] synthase II
MDNNRRVVITGIGAIAPNGISREAFWDALKNGRSGIKKISYFDSSIFPSHVAGEINDFNTESFLPVKTIRRTDRSTHFAIAATSLALEDSKLKLTDKLKEEIHIIIGTAMSGHVSYIEQLRVYFTKGYKSVSPFAAVSCFPDACSGQLAIFFGFKGPTETICAGCAASTNAVIDVFKKIKLGETDICIAGGTDAPLREEIYCAFSQAKVLSQKENNTPAPFDKNRDGTVLSEGAGIVIVEELNHALKRNAPIYAEIIGSGITTDAYQMAGTEPSGKERARAVKIALKSAGIMPEEVEYINAHGTGTVINDSNETAVIKDVFGKYAYKIPISSTKSMIGHTQGACGVLEIIATILALKEGIIHPTINYQTFDEECDLNYAPNKAIYKEVNIAISNSFAFGGKNSIIVLKRFNQ